jgi:hypothetical protein
VIDIHQVGYHEKKKKESFKKASVLKNVKYYYLFGPLFVEEKIHEIIGCPPTTLQNLDKIFTSLFLLCEK